MRPRGREKTDSGAEEILVIDSLLELAVDDLELRVDADHLELRLVAEGSCPGLGPTDDAHADNFDEQLLGGELTGETQRQSENSRPVMHKEGL